MVYDSGWIAWPFGHQRYARHCRKTLPKKFSSIRRLTTADCYFGIRFDITLYQEQIRANTLVIHGNKDGLVAPSHGKFLAKVIPNARFVLVDGMGHDLPNYYYPYLTGLISEHCQA